MFKKAAVYIKEKINKNGFTFAEMLCSVLVASVQDERLYAKNMVLDGKDSTTVLS